MGELHAWYQRHAFDPTEQALPSKKLLARRKSRTGASSGSVLDA